MSNLICSKCMEVLESKDGKCPKCHSGYPHTYEFKNSDEYLRKETKRVIEMRKESGLEGLVGRAHYSDVAKGMAMMEAEGFSKAVVDRDSWKILGFHIIGPHAPILLQEVINAMALGGSLHSIGEGMHIHPALPELVVTALSRLQEP
jgi:hypothetical protein